jgi:hypothetical protein
LDRSENSFVITHAYFQMMNLLVQKNCKGEEQCNKEEGPPEHRLRQVGARQVRLAEDCAVEVAALQSSADQLGALQHRVRQVGAREIAAREIGGSEVGLREVAACGQHSAKKRPLRCNTNRS